MNVSTVTDGVYRLSVNTTDILFEGIWPIPNGVSMNSYIVKGEKTAIIDGVCGWDGVPDSLFTLLEQLNVPIDSIDYVVINHMEPDHSGWLEDFKKIRSDFQILTSDKAVGLLKAFFDIDQAIQVVKPGDEVDLGNGRVLTFEYTPNVHWPETMVTYDKLSQTLFSCDAFGSFGMYDETPYDDMMSEEAMKFFDEETMRYYSNIVSVFSHPVKKAIEKLADVPIKIIAPGHGIVWRENPTKIVEDYVRYADYSCGVAENRITVIWGSMYGMTEKGVNVVLDELEKHDVDVRVHNVPESHIGDILTSVWPSTGVVLAMPTYEYMMFPPMAAVIDELGKKKVINRKAFRIGSYGWSGGAQRELDDITERLRMRWDFIEPVEFHGQPTEEDNERIREGVRKLVSIVKATVDDNS